MRRIALGLLVVLAVAAASCAQAPVVTGTWRLGEQGRTETDRTLVLHPNHEFEMADNSAAAPHAEPVRGTWSFDDGVLVLSVQCPACGVVKEEESVRIKVTELAADSMTGVVGEGSDKVVLKRVRAAAPDKQ